MSIANGTVPEQPLWPSENARGYRIPDQVYGTVRIL